jgi:hypothetical protein
MYKCRISYEDTLGLAKELDVSLNDLLWDPHVKRNDACSRDTLANIEYATYNNYVWQFLLCSDIFLGLKSHALGRYDCER